MSEIDCLKSKKFKNVVIGDEKNGALFVSGKEKIDGDLSVSNRTTLVGALNVDGRTNINNLLSISSDAFIAGNTTIQGKLSLEGKMNLSGGLNIFGRTNLDGTLSVANKAYLSDANIRGNLWVDGSVNINNTLTFGSSYNKNKLSIWDDGTNKLGIGIQANDLGFHLDSTSSDFTFYDDEAWSNDLLKIKGGGNIGIGTDNPQSKLDIEGGVAIGSTYSGTTAAPTNGLIVEGIVGIGTNNPSTDSKLDVDGSMRAGYDTDTASFFGRTAIGGFGTYSDYAWFSHVDRVSAGDYALLQSPLGRTFLNASSGQSIQFRIDNTLMMMIDNLGNIGVGDSSPQSKLDVAGNVAIGSTYSGTTAAPTNGLIVEGNIGIGKSSPNAKLDVEGITNLSGGLNVKGTTNLNGNLSVENKAYFSNANIRGNLWIDGSANLHGGLKVGNYKFPTAAGTNGHVLKLSGGNLVFAADTTGGETAIANLRSDNGKIQMDSFVNIAGRLNVSGKANFETGLNVSGRTNLSGSLSVEKKAYFSDANIRGNLWVDGSANLHNGLKVGNYKFPTTAGTNGHVLKLSSGNLIFAADDSGTTIENLRSDNGKIQMDSFVNIAGRLNVSGKANFETGLNVSGRTNLSGNLSVEKKAYFSDANIRGNLWVDGSANLHKGLKVGNYKFPTTAGTNGHVLKLSSGNLIFAADDSGTTIANLSSDNGKIQMDSFVNIAGRLNVSGKANFEKGLNVSGRTNLSGSLSVEKKTILSNTLNVHGKTNLSGGLNVFGTTNLNGTLSVKGLANLASDLKVGGNLNIGKTLSVKGKSFFSNVNINSNLEVVTSANFYNNIDVKSLTNTRYLNLSSIFTNYSNSKEVLLNVSVNPKTSNHPRSDRPSTSGYYIENIESPVIEVIPNMTYKFINIPGLHPLRFYLDEDRTTPYTTGVSDDGATVSIVISDNTPNILYYQCSSHAYMGNYLLVKGTKNLNVIGSANVMGNLRVNGNANIHGTLNVGVRITTKNIQCNSIIKGSGTFKIDHPVPKKSKTHWLYHSFVESPTTGDNIYRYNIETNNKKHVIQLEEYHKYLNTNYQAWVNPDRHFGRGYGYVENNNLYVEVDIDGKYNVLLIGTRKDKLALENWNGVEVEK